ncbi:MAG: T9SS type A sorting domain-containing protein [Bacteroidia bacterium]|nr:T9SS type A sorting domain-containing protein [Bacteroidia bacterium]
MRKLYALLFVVLLAANGLVAQRTCGTMDHLHEQMQSDPSIAKSLQKQENEIQRFVRENGENFRTPGGVINIPVVVHVVYRTTQQNISDTQVQSQIAVLNEDYSGTNADVTSVPGAWTSLVANTGIQFCLASRDPQGLPTTGIVRVNTTVTSFGMNGDPVKYTSQGGSDAWPRDSYLNLWVCNLGQQLLGYAQFPGSGLAATDGVVVLYNAFGRTGTVSAPYNKGRTCTHEVGHWLNLRHIWGDDGGACNGTDFVADTPNQAGENYNCLSFPATDACSATSPGVMFMNYMDYTPDACMYFFTNGQGTRMNATLSGTRSSLANSQGCVPVNLPSNDAGVLAISSPSGTYCTEQITPTFTLKNFGLNTLTSVTINWQIDGGAVSTQAWTGSLSSLAATNVTLPVQTVSAGNHTITIYTTNPNGATDGDVNNDSNSSSFTIATSGQALPFAYNFTSTTWPPAGWTLNNPDNSFTWEHKANVGNGGNGSVWVNNYDYNARGEVDEFLLPSVNLSGVSGADVTFDLSYVLYSQTGYSDTLALYASTDCGTSWTEIYRKFDQALTTVTPYYLQSAFTPSSPNQWRNESVSLGQFVGNSNVIVKFVNITDYENNLYLDNINIQVGAVAVANALPSNAVSVFPNPNNGMFSVNVNLPNPTDVKLAVFNSIGQQVASRNLTGFNNGKLAFDLSSQAAGVYYLRVEADGKSIIKKVSLQ